MSQRTPHARRLVLFALLLVVSLTACGGDGGSDEPIVPDRGDGLAEGPEAPEGVDAPPSSTVVPGDTTSTTTLDATTTTSAPPSPETTVAPTEDDDETDDSSDQSTTDSTVPDNGFHITVDGTRYALQPTECDVWEESDVLISGTAVTPDGTEAYFAIDVTPDGMGAVLLDFGSDDEFDRSDETLIAGYGATPDEHFEATVTGDHVEIVTTFVEGRGSDPMPGTAEIDCSLV